MMTLCPANAAAPLSREGCFCERRVLPAWPKRKEHKGGKEYPISRSANSRGRYREPPLPRPGWARDSVGLYWGTAEEQLWHSKLHANRGCLQIRKTTCLRRKPIKGTLSTGRIHDAMLNQIMEGGGEA